MSIRWLQLWVHVHFALIAVWLIVFNATQPIALHVKLVTWVSSSLQLGYVRNATTQAVWGATPLPVSSATKAFTTTPRSAPALNAKSALRIYSYMNCKTIDALLVLDLRLWTHKHVVIVTWVSSNPHLTVAWLPPLASLSVARLNTHKWHSQQLMRMRTWYKALYACRVQLHAYGA